MVFAFTGRVSGFEGVEARVQGRVQEGEEGKGTDADSRIWP